jgi:hypothetical protein
MMTLTAPMVLAYAESVKTLWGCHVSPAGCGEEAVKYLSGVSARRVSVHREVHGGFHKGLNTTRRFYFVPIVKTLWRCFMAQKDCHSCEGRNPEPFRWYQLQDARGAVDATENVKCIISFISDSITQEGKHEGYSLSENGVTGLYLMLAFIEGILDDCVNMLAKEV